MGKDIGITKEVPHNHKTIKGNYSKNVLNYSHVLPTCFLLCKSEMLERNTEYYALKTTSLIN